MTTRDTSFEWYTRRTFIRTHHEPYTLTQDLDPTLSQKLAAFGIDMFADPSRIPEPVREQCAQRLLDNIGCIHFALSVPPARKMAELAARLGRGDCHVIGMDGTTSPPAAALAHGLLNQAFEINDLGAYVHAGACVIPACLAALEESKRPVSGAQLVAAIVAGYELTVRLAESIGAGAELDVGWHTPGFHGAVGASLAAALILGSDAATIAQTIAIAADMAGGGLMVARLGSDTKRLHCGRGAETAVLAALFAREGVKTRLDTLEHPTWGYCRAMAGGKPPADLDALTRLLGEKYVGFDRTAIKYYCAGAEVQGVVDNINKLKRRDGFSVDAIESITVGTPKFFVLAESHRFPESVTEVHFNVEYGVAMALSFDVAPVHEAGGELLRRWMTGFQDPRVRALAALVRHETDDELDRRNPYGVDSKVSIRLRDGSTMWEETQYVRQMESKATMRFAPMDLDKIKRKFAVLTEHAMSEQKRDALTREILEIESRADARGLWQALRR